MDLGPEIEPRHHHTGRAWIDVLLGVSAVAISLMSLGLAIAHGRAMERLVEANTWPFVMAGIGTADKDGAPRLNILLLNKGVGPAKIESLEVNYEGHPVTSGHALIRTMLGLTDPAAPAPKFFVLNSGIVGGVLASKESIDVLEVRPGQSTPAEMNALRRGGEKMTFRVCYCSVFDECYLLDTASSPGRVRPIKSCPMPKVPYAD